VVTGEYAAPILRQLFDTQGFSDVRILAVENRSSAATSRSPVCSRDKI